MNQTKEEFENEYKMYLNDNDGHLDDNECQNQLQIQNEQLLKSKQIWSEQKAKLNDLQLMNESQENKLSELKQQCDEMNLIQEQLTKHKQKMDECSLV